MPEQRPNGKEMTKGKNAPLLTSLSVQGEQDRQASPQSCTGMQKDQTTTPIANAGFFARVRRRNANANANETRSLVPITSALAFFSHSLFLSLLLLMQPEPRLRLYSRLVPSPQGRRTIAAIKPASVHVRAIQQHRP